MPSNNKRFCGLALENDPMPQQKSFCRVSDNNKPRKFVFQAKKAFGGCCRPMLLRFISNKSPWLQGGSAWLATGEGGPDAIRIISLRLLLHMMGPLLLGCRKQGMHACITCWNSQELLEQTELCIILYLNASRVNVQPVWASVVQVNPLHEYIHRVYY